MYRIQRIIIETIERLELNLEGLTVYTEAASGHYIYTPIIGALAGAKVFAFTKDSVYGYAAVNKQKLVELSKQFDVFNRIEIVFEKKGMQIHQADIVTNSGLLRPINQQFIELMKPGSVIALMYEAWERRESDIEIDVCRKKGIKVVGVNEDHSLVDVFRYVGILAVKLLLESEIEVYKCNIGILSSDKFGKAIGKYLERCGAQVKKSNSLSELLIDQLDAVIYSSYNRNIKFDSASLRFMRDNGIRIIQFLGIPAPDYQSIKRFGIDISPDKPVPSNAMSFTFSSLGPKPVIELHAAGLKAAEIVLNEVDREKTSFQDLVQLIV